MMMMMNDETFRRMSPLQANTELLLLALLLLLLLPLARGSTETEMTSFCFQIRFRLGRFSRY
jgi:hypothetical protein